MVSNTKLGKSQSANLPRALGWNFGYQQLIGPGGSFVDFPNDGTRGAQSTSKDTEISTDSMR
jgi:hypothetical protein